MSDPRPALQPALPMILADEHARLSRRCAESRARSERADLLSIGQAEADADLLDACASLLALEDLILATPADSLPALALKARLLNQIPAACRHPDEVDAMVVALVRDIERLAG